jgi:hypothetical protein
MATTAKRKTTNEQGLGIKHQRARDALMRKLQDGSPCDWCGKPRYRDETKNWDYNPDIRYSGRLQADHGAMTRAEAVRRGLPIPLPDRLLHRRCNQQRGDGVNDHLAVSGGGAQPERLAMAWPW